jgi:hypothetical protein
MGSSTNSEQIFALLNTSIYTFTEEMLMSLSGKVSPLNSYLSVDNFVIIGIGNIVSIKDINCLDNIIRSSWKHYKKDITSQTCIFDAGNILEGECLFKVVTDFS